MKKLLLVLLFSFPLLASQLHLQDGFVQAHTEMLMESNIDPLNKSLHADVSIKNDDILTLRGNFWIEMDLFVSDNKDRDEHMDETTDVKTYPQASFSIISITKKDVDIYTLKGEMDFHGVKKELLFESKIINKDNGISLSAKTDINGTDFGLEMPCLIFMCVDNKISILVEADFSK